MTKGKVIGFVKEHKKDIIHIAVTGAIGVVAFKAGKRQVSKNKSEFDKCIDDMINDILNNAYELYSDKTMGFVGLTGKKLSIKPVSYTHLDVYKRQVCELISETHLCMVI